MISTVDPEARHAHKTRSRRVDGCKAHIVAEPHTDIITATELTTADASDAQVGARLLDSDPTHNTAHNTADSDSGWLVLADSAYASGEALESFTDAGWGTAIKPIERRSPMAGGFTRDDFGIDTDAQTVTCPAGHTRPVTSGAARFGKLCDTCPLRTRCTTLGHE